jgi:hypothetical protein
MRIYLAARFGAQQEMRGVRDVLTALGHEITSSWIDCDTDEVGVDGLTPDVMNADPERCAPYAATDIADLLRADTVMVFTVYGPSTTGGRHVRARHRPRREQARHPRRTPRVHLPHAAAGRALRRLVAARHGPHPGVPGWGVGMTGEPLVTLVRAEMDYGDDRLPARYWEKVYPCPVTGCWLWGAAQHDTLPYGIWRAQDGTTGRAHVSSFMASGGVVSPELPHVLHGCDQPACVRPVHLRAGTQAQNMDDAKRRGRLAVGSNSPLTSDQVIALRERYAEGDDGAALAEEYGIARSALSLIVRGLRWSTIGGPLTLDRPRVGTPSPAREKTTCKFGHEFTPENTRWKPNAQCRDGLERICRKCDRRRATENNDRRRGPARKRAI